MALTKFEAQERAQRIWKQPTQVSKHTGSDWWMVSTSDGEYHHLDENGHTQCHVACQQLEAQPDPYKPPPATRRGRVLDPLRDKRLRQNRNKPTPKLSASRDRAVHGGQGRVVNPETDRRLKPKAKAKPEAKAKPVTPQTKE